MLSGDCFWGSWDFGFFWGQLRSIWSGDGRWETESDAAGRCHGLCGFKTHGRSWLLSRGGWHDEKKTSWTQDERLLKLWNSFNTWVREYPNWRSRLAKGQCGCRNTTVFWLPSRAQMMLLVWILLAKHNFQAWGGGSPLLCCSAVVSSLSPLPAKGKVALLTQNTGAGMKGSLSIFVLSFYAPFHCAFLWLVQSYLVQFFSLSPLARKEGKITNSLRKYFQLCCTHCSAQG